MENGVSVDITDKGWEVRVYSFGNFTSTFFELSEGDKMTDVIEDITFRIKEITKEEQS